MVVLTLTFAACNLNDGNGGNGGDEPVGGGDETVDPNPVAVEFSDAVTYNNDDFYKDYSAEEKELYYTLWQETTTVSIKVDITSYELAKINEAVEDYFNGNTLKADTYRKCNLTITVNGTDYYYEEVGIRMRGNTSRRYFIDSDGYVNNFVHFRFNLSETFDGEEYENGAWGADIYHEWTSKDARKARKNRSFATMEKFYYKWNKNYDQTYIREVYANRMFRAYGVLAPHITLAQLQLKQNGKTDMLNMGVGNIYETVDKAFIKRHFGKERKGGDLYKCGWGSGFGADFTTLDGAYGVETPTQRFTYSLKTNDDRTAADYNHNAYLKAFVDMLQTNKNSSDFKTKLEAMVDMDYFARFEAVNYLLGNPDCIRNNFNNFYIYFVPVADGDYTKSKAYIIPYDYDRCLGANMEWNPKNSMVDVEPFSVSGVNTCTNPLYTKTILDGGIAAYREAYTKKLTQVLQGTWFTYENYEKLFNAYKAHYGSLAMPNQLIQQKCGGNINFARFTFSLTESNKTDSATENLSVKRYFELKRATANKAL